MMIRLRCWLIAPLTCAIFTVLVSNVLDSDAFAFADEPASKPIVSEDERLTPAAEAIVTELRESLPNDSEAIAMLEGILSGSTLNSDDG